MHVAAKGISHQGQLIIWQKSSQVSLYTTHSQAAGGNHRSVIFRPASHHSSVVFRYDNSVDHHSDDSVGPFGHDYSVSRSQRDFQSEHYSALKRSSKQQEMLTQKLKPAEEQAEQISPEIFEHQQLRVYSPAAIQSFKCVAIETAKQGEFSATKIVQNKGWKRWESNGEMFK
ncbi:hypothetical protein F511_42212 [Dorcoceras hygrometricum]|uniref:Uncharacterized protein n=1 Tax=Dorcoceras hygrometricum TaxID=472368 RepID=A0A2Z7BC54_9LAMI|nr:hypothetical protein F511_42212 [Dorcoceras hygrometricum]